MDDQLPRPAAPAVPYTNGFTQDKSPNPVEAVLQNAPKLPVRPDAGLVSNSPIPPAPVVSTPAINDTPQPQPTAMPATDQVNPVINTPQPAPVEPVASPPPLVNNAPLEPIQPQVTAPVSEPTLPTPPAADALVSNQPPTPVVQPQVDNTPISEPIIFREPDPIAAEPEIPRPVANMTEPVTAPRETPIAQAPVSSSSDPHQFIPAFQAPSPIEPVTPVVNETPAKPPVMPVEPVMQNEPEAVKTEEAPVEYISAPWEPETVATPAVLPTTETNISEVPVSPPAAPVVTFDSPVSPPETMVAPESVAVPPTSPDTPAWLSNQAPVTEMAAMQPEPAVPVMPETLTAVDLNPAPMIATPEIQPETAMLNPAETQPMSMETNTTPAPAADSSSWETFLNGSAPDIPSPPPMATAPIATPEVISPMPQAMETAIAAQPDITNPVQVEVNGGMDVPTPMGNPSDQPAGQSEKPVEANAKSRKPLIFLVILLALFILGSVAALGYKYLTGGSLAAFAPPPQPTPMAQPTQAPPSPTAHPLASWVPFQSTAFPVSMMYPPEWRHENGSVLESPKETLTGPNNCSLEFAFGGSGGPTGMMTEEPVVIDGKAFTKKIWFDEDDRMVLFAYVPENPIPNWEMMTAVISAEDQVVCPETIELMVSTIKFKQTVQGAIDEPEPTKAASSSANPSSRSQLISLLLE